jgi:hypothetical protein
MKEPARNKRMAERHKTPARAGSATHATRPTHTTGASLQRVALPEVDVFTDSDASPEVEGATRDLQRVHDAQVADDDFQ